MELGFDSRGIVEKIPFGELMTDLIANGFDPSSSELWL